MKPRNFTPGFVYSTDEGAANLLLFLQSEISLKNRRLPKFCIPKSSKFEKKLVDNDSFYENLFCFLAEKVILSITRILKNNRSKKGEQMNIYVGNLSRDVTDDDLRAAFENHGVVESAKVIRDKFSGESRGFGFVEMPSKEEAKAAMTALDSSDLKGKNISVNEARPKTDRGHSGGGGRGGYGGGKGGGYGGGRGGGGGRRRF